MQSKSNIFYQQKKYFVNNNVFLLFNNAFLEVSNN